MQVEFPMASEIRNLKEKFLFMFCLCSVCEKRDVSADVINVRGVW